MFGKTQSVSQLKDKGDVKGLIARLRSKTPGEAMEAAQALGEMGGESGAQALRQLLLDSDPLRRLVGAAGFMAIRDPRATPVLVQMLSAEELAGPIRNMTIMALGRLKNPIAVAPLIDLYRRSGRDREVRPIALLALGGIGGDVAREFLMATCSDTDRALRSNAITALGRTGDSRAFDMLKSEWANWEEGANRRAFQEVFAEGYEIIRGLVGIGGEEVEQFLRAEREAATNSDVRNLLGDAIDHREKIVL